MNMRIEVNEDASGKRLDQFLKEALPELSRGRIQKAIQNGSCLLDDQVINNSSYRVKNGQKIIFNSQEEKTELKAEDGELKIPWFDADIAICDKSPNLTVHPCPSCPENTLVQRLLSRFPSIADMGGERPGIVHRLDKDTSGLILVALSEEARLKLTEAFAEREIGKEYLALVYGAPEDQGECKLPLGRHPEIRTKMAVVPENKGGKNAHTVWKRLWTSPDKNISLLSIKIHTGRTHQIRVHMSHLGHPLLGDRLYAPPHIRDMAPRQMLHAARLEFTHPITNERLSFTSPPPDDFVETIIKNTDRAYRIVVTGNPGSGKSSFSKELVKLGLPVIDADAIIKKLYSSSSDVGSWLSMRGFDEAVSSNGSIIKRELMSLFEKRPEFRHEFENFVHALVKDEINSFWLKHNNGLGAVAEVPLFFEAAWQKADDEVLTVGIHSGQKTRFDRLVNTRNWTKEKIGAIESWQMPENEKMAKCDLVYENEGSLQNLRKAAENFMEFLNNKRKKERNKLIELIKKICLKEIQGNF